MILDYVVSPLFNELEIEQRKIQKSILETFMQQLYQKEGSKQQKGAQASTLLSSFGLYLFWKVTELIGPQHNCLENRMDGGAWQDAAHEVAKSRTRLSDFAFTFHFHALEKEMATHSGVLAWRVPGMGKPGGLPSMGSHRVGHD